MVVGRDLRLVAVPAHKLGGRWPPPCDHPDDAIVASITPNLIRTIVPNSCRYVASNIHEYDYRRVVLWLVVVN